MEEIKELQSLLNKNQIQFKLEKTGIFDEDIEPLFTHLILSSMDDFHKLKNIEWKNLMEEFEIDFISVKRECIKKEFIHITDIDSSDNINDFGFKIPTDVSGDLGVGVYFIDNNNIDGKINLENYIYDNYNEDDEIAVITIEYTGDYLECVLGDNHKGYIIIKSAIPEKNITNIDYINAEDFEEY